MQRHAAPSPKTCCTKCSAPCAVLVTSGDSRTKPWRMQLFLHWKPPFRPRTATSSWRRSHPFQFQISQLEVHGCVVTRCKVDPSPWYVKNNKKPSLHHVAVQHSSVPFVAALRLWYFVAVCFECSQGDGHALVRLPAGSAYTQIYGA